MYLEEVPGVRRTEVVDDIAPISRSVLSAQLFLKKPLTFVQNEALDET